MKILLTGGAGFIGSAVVRAWQRVLSGAYRLQRAGISYENP